jgi:hypothetical protein
MTARNLKNKKTFKFKVTLTFVNTSYANSVLEDAKTWSITGISIKKRVIKSGYVLEYKVKAHPKDLVIIQKKLSKVIIK